MATDHLSVPAARVAVCMLALIAPMVLGCGNRRPVMEGRVTLDGLPVRKGAIQLKPADGKGQTAGTGVVDGLYKMDCSLGTMKVIVNWPQVHGKMLDPGGSGQMIDRYVESVPPRYNDKSELTVTIKSGLNKHDFELEGSALPSADAR